MEQPSASQVSEDPRVEPARTQGHVLRLPPFEYSQLDTPTSIRVLEILPPASNVICCKMTKLDLEHPSGEQQYVALSYTWNDPITIIECPVENMTSIIEIKDYAKLPYYFPFRGPGGIELHTLDSAMRYYVETHPWIPRERALTAEKTTKLIELDGHQISVQENLYHFPKEYSWVKTFIASKPPAGEGGKDDHALRKVIHLPVWIDALCINQSDVEERASQVQLMDRVFRSAKLVFAWLGAPDSFTNDAMEGLGLIYSSDIVSVKSSGKMTLSSISEMDLVHWFAVFAFFQRSWFKRAWVTQEVVFGRESITVLHGGRTMPFEYLSMLAEALASLDFTLR